MQKLSSIFERVIFLLVLVLFIFVPLYPKLPVFNVAKTFVAIRLEDFLIAFVIILWSVYILISGKWKMLIRDKVIQLMGLFFGVGLLSVFSGYFVTHSIQWHLGLLHYFRRVELMLLLPVVMTVITTQKQVKTILWTITGVTVLVCLYAFGQQYLGWPVISTGNSEFSKGLLLSLTPGARVNSTFAGHYDLAVYLVMIITVVLAVFIGWKSMMLRIYLCFIGGLSTVVLVMTAARLSLLAVLFGVISVIILGKKWKYLLVLMVLSVVVVAYPSQLRDRFVSTLKVNVLDQGTRYEASTVDQDERSTLNIPTLPMKIASQSAENVEIEQLTETESATASAKVASDIVPGEPIDSTQLGVFRSLQIRTQIEWPRALNAFYKNPLIGTGYSSLGIATDNDILRSLGEVGLMGTIVFSLLHIEILRRFFRQLKSRNKLTKFLSIGLIGVIVAFVVNSTFIDVYEASKIATFFWMILGVGLATKFYEEDN
jgi:hypothetical protein